MDKVRTQLSMCTDLPCGHDDDLSAKHIQPILKQVYWTFRKDASEKKNETLACFFHLLKINKLEKHISL